MLLGDTPAACKRLRDTASVEYCGGGGGIERCIVSSAGILGVHFGRSLLPASEEDFWSGLGYAVIQGYGLTETAPSVTITHPFKGIKRGSVGKKLPGIEMRIAEDGQILVRGPNVSPGYYRNQQATHVFHDGWLHTGDLGRFDEGNDLIQGTQERCDCYGQWSERITIAGHRIGAGKRRSGEGSGHRGARSISDRRSTRCSLCKIANRLTRRPTL